MVTHPHPHPDQYLDMTNEESYIHNIHTYICPRPPLAVNSFWKKYNTRKSPECPTPISQITDSGRAVLKESRFKKIKIHCGMMVKLVVFWSNPQFQTESSTIHLKLIMPNHLYHMSNTSDYYPNTHFTQKMHIQ